MKRPKRIINDPRAVVEEMLEGLVLAHDGEVVRLEGRTALMRPAIPAGKVALIVGGGSGHEPVYHGLVGDRMADGAVLGNVFAAPTPDVIVDLVKAVDRGAGVLFVYGNYAGDNMNFDIAAEMAEAEGIRVRTVRVCDDVAAAPPEQAEERRGIAGLVFQVKIAGAAAAALDDLDAVVRVVEKAKENIRTMGVAIAPGSIPETGLPTFELGDDEIEIGMGAHGEPGVSRQKLLTADAVTDLMMDKIRGDLPLDEGSEVALLVNNLGATTMMEMLIVYRRVRQILADRKVAVYRSVVGTYVTSQEMAGLSITVMTLDDELKHYLDTPASCFAFGRI